jgi:hypothetical protein
MSEFASIDRSRYELVSGLVKTMYDALVGQVIADIKALPDSCRQSGDDSKLKDVWEEYKYQVQRDESGMFELYVQVIRDICTRRVRGVERDRQQLLWLWTEGFLDLWGDKEEVSLDDWDPEAIAAKLYECISDVAGNEELEVDPDEERDRERYEEDGGQ